MFKQDKACVERGICKETQASLLGRLGFRERGS